MHSISIITLDYNELAAHADLAASVRSIYAAYTRSLLEDPRLFGPSPWKILAATMKKTYLSNPAPGENLLSGNLVMETGCTCHILPPSEIDWGLFLADFAGSEGKSLFHRIG